MLERPDILLIGATRRHVGKTLFTCRVIEASALRYAVFGIKVTVFGKADAGSQSHRAFADGYDIMEERECTSGKDTARMLQAGAQRVWWLRAPPEALERGVSDLLGRIPAGAGIVCESNRVRAVLKPGLFLILTGAEEGGGIKPSCRDVMRYADQVLSGEPGGWTVDPARIVFHNGRWSLSVRRQETV